MAVFSVARQCDDAKDGDLAEAMRVRDLGLPALPPLKNRSIGREPAQPHTGLDLA